MSDKTRAEFEEWWEYIRNSAYTSEERHAAMAGWYAAKEKHEPRRVPVSERMPEVALNGRSFNSQDFYVSDGKTTGVCAFESGAYGESGPWNAWSGYGDMSPEDITHWMPLPSAPSTQGGGE